MERKAYFAVLIGAIMAGSSGVFIKHLSIPSTSIAFIRTALPTLILGLILWWNGTRFFRGNYKLMMAASALNAVRLFCFFTAYILTSIGNAVIISFTWPIFVTLLSVVFLRESISRRNVTLLLLAFVGIVIVYSNKPFSFENRDFVGMTAALGVALFHAIGVVIFKKESNNYSPKEIIFYQNFLGAFIFLPFIIYNEPIPTTFDITVASSYSILLGIIGFHFFFFGLRHLKASTASMITYIEVISALCFSVFWMKEELTLNMLIGGGLIISSTLFLRR